MVISTGLFDVVGQEEFCDVPGTVVLATRNQARTTNRDVRDVRLAIDQIGKIGFARKQNFIAMQERLRSAVGLGIFDLEPTGLEFLLCRICAERDFDI